MREVVLDTETTGLEPAEGHRIVEIGALELVNHVPTGRSFHHYIHPQRSVPAEAVAVHGLSDEFLRDKPVFQSVGPLLLEFIADSRLVIHNAAFDLKFLNSELGKVSLPALSPDRATDTLLIARKRFPGSPATLDALCRRFGVDNAHREKHGALLDSELLAEVYLELMGGRQPTLVLSDKPHLETLQDVAADWRPGPRQKPLPTRLTAAESNAHAAFVAALGDRSVWRMRD